MLPVNDLRKGDAIILDGETYLVVDAHFHRAQQRKANVKTKLKNMLKGNMIEKTFSSFRINHILPYVIFMLRR